MVTFVCLYCRPEHKLGTRSRENWPAVINRNIIRDINNSVVVKCREIHGSYCSHDCTCLCKKHIKKSQWSLEILGILVGYIRWLL